MKWDLLLEWMTHVGSGPWSVFRDAVDELDEGAAGDHEHEQVFYRNLRIALSDLGHVDFFVGGTHRWQVRRPVLLGLAGSATEHVFSGGRTSVLAKCLAGTAFDAGAVVTIGESRPGLSRIHIDGDPNTLHSAAKSLGIQYLPKAAARLTAWLPMLRKTLNSARMAEEPINWTVRSLSFRDARWVPERLDNTVREYTNRHGVRRYLLAIGRRRVLHEIEKRAAVYCAALIRNERIVDYSYRNQTLRVPFWAPLPGEHARAASLASGSLAEVVDKGLVFRNIDPPLASALMVTLGQGIPMPEV